jgi:hypothetical protein
LSDWTGLHARTYPTIAAGGRFDWRKRLPLIRERNLTVGAGQGCNAARLRWATSSAELSHMREPRLHRSMPRGDLDRIQSRLSRYRSARAASTADQCPPRADGSLLREAFPTEIAIGACGSSPYWARQLSRPSTCCARSRPNTSTAASHPTRMTGLTLTCEATGRSGMHSLPVKSVDQQAS